MLTLILPEGEVKEKFCACVNKLPESKIKLSVIFLIIVDIYKWSDEIKEYCWRATISARFFMWVKVAYKIAMLA